MTSFLLTDYGSLLSQLATAQGSPETRTRVLKAVMYEASRFKRHSLLNVLKTYQQQQAQPADVTINGTTSIRINGHTR